MATLVVAFRWIVQVVTAAFDPLLDDTKGISSRQRAAQAATRDHFQHTLRSRVATRCKKRLGPSPPGSPKTAKLTLELRFPQLSK